MRKPVLAALDTCPIEVSIAILGGAWKLSAMRYLLTRTHRFGELQRALDGVTPRTLARVLRELEADGIVSRTVHPEVPPRVEYSPTELGESLRPLVTWLEGWGNAYPERSVAPDRIEPML